MPETKALPMPSPVKGSTRLAASPINTQFSFNHSDLVAQEKSILGSYMGSCVPVRDVPRFLNLYQQGRLPVDKLIDGKITFDDLNEGFDELSKGKVIRQILMPNA